VEAGFSVVNRPNSDPLPKPAFDRGAHFTLLFVLFLVLGSAAQLVYRFGLPTDGWDAEYNNLDELNWVYLQNLVGAPSALQPGDVLIRVEDLYVAGTASSEHLSAPQNWRIEESVTVKVLRDGEPLVLDVPVVRWKLQAVWRRNFYDLSKMVNLPVFLVLFGVGLFSFWKRPDLNPTRALLLISASLVATYISNLLPDGPSAQFDFLAFTTSWFYSYTIVGTLLIPAVFFFALHFPRPKKIFSRFPWLGLLPFMLGGVLLVLLYILPGRFAFLGWVSTMLMALLTIASLVHAYLTQRDAISRAQLRWVIGGFLLSMLSLLMAFPPAFGWVADPVAAGILLAAGFSLAFILITLSISIAVLRYRLFDIDLIIRRTLQYAILTGLLSLVYFGGVALLQALLSADRGPSTAGGMAVSGPSPAVIVLTTLAIAALFNPLRNRIQDFIDRRFYRQKYDVELALAKFAEAARSETDLETLTGSMSEVVQTTLQPETISVWLSPYVFRRKSQE